MIVDTDEQIIGKFRDHYNTLVQNVKSRLQSEITQYANISYNVVLQETVFFVYERDKNGELIEPTNIISIKIPFKPTQIQDLMFLQSSYHTEEEVDAMFTEIGKYCVNILIKILQTKYESKYSFFDIIADENEALFAMTQQLYRKTLASDLTQPAV